MDNGGGGEGLSAQPQETATSRDGERDLTTRVNNSIPFKAKVKAKAKVKIKDDLVSSVRHQRTSPSRNSLAAQVEKF